MFDELQSLPTGYQFIYLLEIVPREFQKFLPNCHHCFFLLRNQIDVLKSSIGFGAQVESHETDPQFICCRTPFVESTVSKRVNAKELGFLLDYAHSKLVVSASTKLFLNRSSPLATRAYQNSPRLTAVVTGHLNSDT